MTLTPLLTLALAFALLVSYAFWVLKQRGD